MRIGPHPHTSLQTVTWLLEGEVVHTDSLGSEQLIRPGQLNLMTSGHGVVHAEETPASYRGAIHAVQLWVAQPDATRHGDAAFEHHPELPRFDVDQAEVTLLVGVLAGHESPARRDTDHLGADLVLRAGRTTLPVAPDHEHAIVVLDGDVSVAGTRVDADALVYLGAGRDELVLDAHTGARAILVGGAPFEARPFMWWNFVGRTRGEVDEAYEQWQSGNARFGAVPGSGLDVIPAPPPPWRSSPQPFRQR